MKNISFTVALLFMLCQINAQSYNFQKLDSLFMILDQNDKFMGTLAISENQQLIYQRSIGFADVENAIKATDKTKYRIGSISKTFTAALIFKAVESGKLKLDQTIETFFSNVENANEITIANLLNHSSGIYDFTRNEDYLAWNTKRLTRDELLTKITNGNSNFEPTERNEYSNSNYVLLTFILEDSYNMPFSKILKKYITKPLKLKNTYYGKQTSISDNESYSYIREGEWRKETETDMSIPQGAGAIVSSPSDLNVFMEGLFLGKLIKMEHVEEMKTLSNGFGMGLFQFPYNDKVSFGHTGGIDGFQSVSSYFSDEKIAISLTTNGANYDKNNILLAALATVFNEDFGLPSFSTIELTSEQLDQYLGTYATDQMPLKITVTKQGNTLFAQATGQGAFPLDATEENIFTFDPVGVKVEFDPSERTLILYQGGGTFNFKIEE